MNKIIKFLQKRPSDLTIRLVRILFWLLYISALYYNFFIEETPNVIQDSLFWQPISEQTKMIISYIIIAFGIFPLFMWVTNMCIAKGKYIRITQIIYSVILFYFSHIIVEWPDLDIDILIFFMAFVPLFWWVTWKFITSKCLNYWYKKTKIRV
jgi:hypothetical protein